MLKEVYENVEGAEFGDNASIRVTGQADLHSCKK
jgi:hypothetical protein